MVERALEIEGLMKQSQPQLLHRLAISTPAEAIAVEVGSFRGRSTVAIAGGWRKSSGRGS